MNEKSKKKSRQSREEKERWHDGLNPETKHSISAIIFLGLGLFFTLAAFGKAGVVGKNLYKILDFSFGSAFFLLPVSFFLASLALFLSFRTRLVFTTIVGGFIFLLSALGAANILFGEKAGGYLGFVISLPFLKLFDFWASLVLFFTFLIVSFLILFNVPLKIKSREAKEEDGGTIEAKKVEKNSENTVINSLKEVLNDFKDTISEKNTKIENVEAAANNNGGRKQSDKEEEISLRQPKRILARHFQSPPLDIFEGDKGKPSTGDIKANANIIKRTLQNFGISVEMGEITIGPSVTQYTLKPAEGIKLSRIIALHNDLSLALASHPIRIEAPIPGKSLVGIEIPNSAASLVGLHHLFAQEEFRKSERPLFLALGRNVAGQPVYADLSQMPHLLIAGATGSGKSVAIHSLIAGLLFRNPPEMLRLLLIDPKRVELTAYSGLTHLLAPVITEAKKAIPALKWLTKEMERRYDVLMNNHVRDIGAYNRILAENHDGHESEDYEAMPYIVVIIDELADIMMSYPREFEAAIVRLAQMSRAVGIHLILSTQRPSVEVLTGLIKANITSRMAFQVATQIDSRTILDMAGAEKLLGNGDMLYLAGDTAKPRRVQGAFVSEKEVKKLVKHIIDECRDFENRELDIMTNETGSEPARIAARSVGGGRSDAGWPPSMLEESSDDVDDDLYEEAREIIIQNQKASSSYLQRRLKIGYARAARLLDILEERGIVGPGDGAKPREVFIKPVGEESSDL